MRVYSQITHDNKSIMGLLAHRVMRIFIVDEAFAKLNFY